MNEFCSYLESRLFRSPQYQSIILETVSMYLRKALAGVEERPVKIRTLRIDGTAKIKTKPHNLVNMRAK